MAYMADPLPDFDPAYVYPVVADDDTVEDDCDCDKHVDRDED